MPDAPHTLITGGAGFIGSHLTERLLGQGERVVVIDDFSTGSRANLAAVADDPNLTVIESTVTGCESLGSLVAESGYVFHLAAAVGVDLVVQSPIRTIETNLKATEAILEAAAPNRTPMLLPSSSEVYGTGRERGPFRDVPIAGILGDQQAATFGQACLSPGEAKNTYGTGNFVLLNTGTEKVMSKNGLLTTVCYKIGDQPTVYALEGSIAVTGSLVQWLRDNLGMISDAADIGGGVNPALGHQNHTGWGSPRQREGYIDLRLERLEVAVVDAEEAGPRRQTALHFRAVMDLHEHRHPKLFG